MTKSGLRWGDRGRNDAYFPLTQARRDVHLPYMRWSDLHGLHLPKMRVRNRRRVQVMSWLLIDFAICFVLAMYLDNVLPRATGKRRSLWYFLQVLMCASRMRACT